MSTDCPFGPPPWVTRADLAVATRSLSWNYPGEWEDELFDAYGVDPDPKRVDFYRRLWNVGEVSSH